MSISIINIKDSLKINLEEQKSSKKGVKKSISLQDDYVKKEIFRKLNEGIVLHFIRNSIRKNTVNTTFSEDFKQMKYDLEMINKYDEDLNSSLSFISDFDLEGENENDNSFNSSFDEHSVEEIEIIKKKK